MQKHREDAFSLTDALTQSSFWNNTNASSININSSHNHCFKTKSLGFTWNIINSSKTVNGFITWKDMLTFCLWNMAHWK